MSFEQAIRRFDAGTEQRNSSIFAGGRKAPIGKNCDRINGAVVEAKHLGGRIARERPADRRLIEAARILRLRRTTARSSIQRGKLR